ncbi:MerR family transcriptional regulator [Gracilibacillus salinarum]|uniref:MerR family transcriptional regulator n=1 Tax=Gracilibacillus salinarum TaxID=2932255 RepID=A0ABY4GLL1_9BACI|nr:MerR family transcriptional regulator [Gracilibacillus salinarum]UOQ85253.1 MerR family transcriptional regulator [Gracilibacillus salinarum]
MNMKEASNRTNVSADTIRYYERIGLIPPIKRNKNGVRMIDEEDIRWIEFSRQMRSAGLSIESLIEYLALFRSGDDTISTRVELLKDQREELQYRMNQIKNALERLDYKINNYQSHVVPKEKELKDFN